MQIENQSQTNNNPQERDAAIQIIPKNQQPQEGAADLGQISKKEAEAHKRAMENDTYPEWVVVEFPGTDNENVVIDFYTAREAYRYIERNYTEDECDVDVMRRQDDGTLTTEY